MINGITFTLGALKTARKIIFDTNNRHSNRKQKFSCKTVEMYNNENYKK